jgi:kynurenine formamidase
MCHPVVAEAVRERVENEGLPRIDRRTALAGAAAAAFAVAVPGAAEARRIPAKRVRDLTHVFTEGFPVFSGPEPEREDLFTFASAGFYSQKWTFGEHSGTHMDAPGHFVPGGRLTPEITPRELIVPLAVVDISAKAAQNPDAVVTQSDLRAYERRHGRIPRGALVAMYSGWDAKVNDDLAFKGGAAFPNYQFPGWSDEAAAWLLAARNVAALGVDTMSLDPGNSTTFPVHFRLLGANRYGIENLANLGNVRPRGATAFIGVVPWEEGSGGPLRALAVW